MFLCFYVFMIVMTIKKAFLIFTLLVGILLLAVVYIIWPKTKIIISVQPEPFVADFEAKVDKGTSKVLLTLDTIPGQIIDPNHGIPAGWRMVSGFSDGQGRALVFEDSDLNELINYQLDQLIPSGKVFYHNKKYPEQTNCQGENFDVNSGVGILKVHIVRTLIPDFNIAELTNELVNKDVDEAKEYLKNIEGIKDVSIKNLFNFSKKTSSSSQRMKIVIDIF